MEKEYQKTESQRTAAYKEDKEGIRGEPKEIIIEGKRLKSERSSAFNSNWKEPRREN